MGRRPGRSRVPPVLLGLAAVAPALAACAAAGPVLELTPWEPPPGQKCESTEVWHGVAGVVDSTAVAAAVQRLRPADGALLLSVGSRPSREGAPPLAFRIETTLPEADAAALERALEPLYREVVGRSRLLIEVADGNAHRMAQGPSRACPPVVTNRWELARLLTGVARTFEKEASLSVYLQADTTGAVGSARINTGSGDPALDAAVLRAMRHARFHPAVLDTRPVAVWVALDATIVDSCPRGPAGQEWSLPVTDPCTGGRPAFPPPRRRPPPASAS